METEYIVCWDCDDSGMSHHDCGEDTCVCLDDSPNVICKTCQGQGTLIRTEAEQLEEDNSPYN